MLAPKSCTLKWEKNKSKIIEVDRWNIQMRKPGRRPIIDAEVIDE
jgi:hypothetical protein